MPSSSSSAAMEKKLPAVDLSHHLSDLAKARELSPLKGMFKYIELNPDIINMAGGVPSPAYFPFESLSSDTLLPSSLQPSSSFSWFWSLLGLSNGKPNTSHISVPKYAKGKDDVSLSVALQYGTAQGLPALKDFIREFSGKVFRPAYSDWTTLAHAGNTDGWSKVAQTLCNHGDVFLTEEWTYPSALSATKPYGILPLGIRADMQGMRSDDLERVLATWDEKARGAKRPHVMYTVPCGQNPTGANMGEARKKEIYDICVKYDIIIVEDDPYYFLQEGSYVPKHLRKSRAVSGLSDKELNRQFLESLAPSYVRFDYQGRVIRLDTFSKTIAPGSRLGWFTCNPMFAERLERHGETTTNAPCGFSQAMIAQLIAKTWTFTGYMQWLRGIRGQYTARRDLLVDIFYEEFHLQPGQGTGLWAGENVYMVYSKGKSPTKYRDAEKSESKPLLSFIPPEAGMFVWFRAHIENLPGLEKRREDDPETKEQRLWVRFAEAGVLVGAGYLFAADTNDERLSTESHFRISFSNADRVVMKNAIKTFARVLKELEHV